MDAKQVKTAWEDVEKRLKTLNVETAWLKGEDDQIGEALRALLPVTDAGDCVLMELMVTPFDENMHLLHIYTAIIMEIGPGYETLKETLLDWNLDSPIGVFGIVRPDRQFCHRYTFPFPVALPSEELAEEAYYLIGRCYSVISRVYPEAVRISGHK